MYSSTKARVKLQQGMSEEYQPNVGIRQGDCLSPLIFNLFINDLSEDLQNGVSDPVTIGEISLTHLLFADDLMLMSRSPTGLQGVLNSLHKYCERWKLNVNLKKTKVIIFQKYGKKQNICKFTLGEEQIENTDTYTYL